MHPARVAREAVAAPGPVAEGRIARRRVETVAGEGVGREGVARQFDTAARATGVGHPGTDCDRTAEKPIS
ncbi:hypothetical protein GCM10009736_35070 [Actinomadura bangladeshensis]